MRDDSNNREGKPKGDKISDKADELIKRSKDFADKAEDFFVKKVRKAKSSDAFDKVSGFFGKVENFMEEKAEEFQSGEMGAKFEAFKDKAGDQASDLLKKAKDAGLKIGNQVDDTLDSIKGKKDQKNNQNGGGI